MKKHSVLSRRSLLRSAGAITAAVAVPSLGKAAEPAISPVMTRLSEYMAAAAGRAIPDEVLSLAKQHILDTFAAIISGAQLAPGRFAIAFARAHAGEKIAT